MSIIAFIPARGGSKSIPRKNIKELGGKPLIVWTIESALQAGLRTVVSTDDTEIAAVATEHGAEVLMRPEELAQDETSMFNVLQSEIPKMDTDLVLLLQPTTPFRDVEDIQQMIAEFSPDVHDSVIAVERVPEKFNPAQVITNGRMADGRHIRDRITRRQDFPPAFTPTGGAYLFKASNLAGGSLYGERVKLFETVSTININDMVDWEAAELCIQKSSQK